MNNLGGQIEKNKNELLPQEIGSMMQGQPDPMAGMAQAIQNMSPEEKAAIEGSIAQLRGR